LGKKALIVLAGKVSKTDFQLAGDCDLKIACDAGLAPYFEFGYKPDILLGDMDSIAKPMLEQAKKANLKMITHPVHKSQSDAELALEYAASKGCDKVMILGMFGGSRPDHEMFNTGLFNLEDELNLKISSFSDGFEIYPIDGEVNIESEPGMIVSVKPMHDGTHIRLDGLEYPLDGLVSAGSTLGLSNVTLGNFSVEVSNKTLLFVQRVKL
jgi:thiamine pyrophosphokinase